MVPNALGRQRIGKQKKKIKIDMSQTENSASCCLHDYSGNYLSIRLHGLSFGAFISSSKYVFQQMNIYKYYIYLHSQVTHKNESRPFSVNHSLINAMARRLNIQQWNMETTNKKNAEYFVHYYQAFGTKSHKNHSAKLDRVPWHELTK